MRFVRAVMAAVLGTCKLRSSAEYLGSVRRDPGNRQAYCVWYRGEPRPQPACSTVDVRPFVNGGNFWNRTHDWGSARPTGQSSSKWDYILNLYMMLPR